MEGSKCLIRLGLGNVNPRRESLDRNIAESVGAHRARRRRCRLTHGTHHGQHRALGDLLENSRRHRLDNQNSYVRKALPDRSLNPSGLDRSLQVAMLFQHAQQAFTLDNGLPIQDQHASRNRIDLAGQYAFPRIDQPGGTLRLPRIPLEQWALDAQASRSVVYVRIHNIYLSLSVASVSAVAFRGFSPELGQASPGAPPAVAGLPQGPQTTLMAPLERNPSSTLPVSAANCTWAPVTFQGAIS